MKIFTYKRDFTYFNEIDYGINFENLWNYVGQHKLWRPYKKYTNENLYQQDSNHGEILIDEEFIREYYFNNTISEVEIISNGKIFRLNYNDKIYDYVKIILLNTQNCTVKNLISEYKIRAFG